MPLAGGPEIDDEFGYYLVVGIDAGISERLGFFAEAMYRSAKAEVTGNDFGFGDVQVDTENLCGVNGHDEITFTKREIEVLSYLAQHPERPVSREELLSKVWGYARTLDIETRTVDIHIAKLRRKIEADPKNPAHLVTVRGAGYRLHTGD